MKEICDRLRLNSCSAVLGRKGLLVVVAARLLQSTDHVDVAMLFEGKEGDGAPNVVLLDEKRRWRGRGSWWRSARSEKAIGSLRNA